MKKIFIIIALCISFFLGSSINVNAKENVYYINKNGVEMSEIEYKNALNVHGYIFLENMTQEMFDKYKKYYSDDNLKITKKELNQNYDISQISQVHNTDYKQLSIEIMSSSSSNRMVVVKVKWKAMPTIRSYDVLGVRLSNASFSKDVTTNVLFDNTSSNISGFKKFSNGYGASIKLPSNCSSIALEQTFEINSGGTVYASYQHANRYISMSDSLNFSISANGLGGVFAFGNNDFFDKMGGVSINT